MAGILGSGNSPLPQCLLCRQALSESQGLIFKLNSCGRSERVEPELYLLKSGKYSQLSLKWTPLGSTPAVCLSEVMYKKFIKKSTK